MCAQKHLCTAAMILVEKLAGRKLDALSSSSFNGIADHHLTTHQVKVHKNGKTCDFLTALINQVQY